MKQRAYDDLVGRERELGELQALLAQSACRLITLSGPGGIGKTSLAYSVAAAWERSGEAVAIVGLSRISNSEQFAATIAEALGLALSALVAPEAHLIAALRERRLLLVLDNCEHLLDGIDLVGRLLDAAPQLRVLATSREVLRLQNEWLYPLSGLSVDTASGASAAAQLFAERARRVQPSFDLAAEQIAVEQICRLCAGMPLAIELAAAWVRTLAPQQIADELGRDIDLLVSTRRDGPAHQRSVAAIFDASWAQLAPHEQQILARMALFRGSFSRESAQAVAGADLHVLSSLIDKSLIQRSAGDRYQLHELLRQYAERRLEADPAAARAAREAFDIHFLHVLERQREPLRGGGQAAAIQAISSDLEHIRQMWRRSLAHDDADTISAAVDTLGVFYEYVGPYGEGIAEMTNAAALLERSATTPRHQEARIVAGLERGYMCIRTGRLEEARAAFGDADAIYAQYDLPPVAGIGTDPQLGYGLLALIGGDYGEAAKIGEQLCARAEAHRHRRNEPFGWYILANAALRQGYVAAARRYAERALELARRNGDHWFMAYCLNDLGTVELAAGNYASARRHFSAGYDLRAEFGDQQGMGAALNLIGRADLLEGRTSAAQDVFERSRAIFAQIADQGGWATALAGLGECALVQGDRQGAADYLRAALEVAQQIGFTPLVLEILTLVAELWIAAGSSAFAADLLALVMRHPAADQAAGERAQRLATSAFPAWDQLGAAAYIPLEAVISRTLRMLQVPMPAEAPAEAGSPDRAEGLTEREHEILGLIAAGLSNQAIAEKLYLSLGTVKWYTGQIYQKLAVQSRTQAIARARALGILALPES